MVFMICELLKTTNEFFFFFLAHLLVLTTESLNIYITHENTHWELDLYSV